MSVLSAWQVAKSMTQQARERLAKAEAWEAKLHRQAMTAAPPGLFTSGNTYVDKCRVLCNPEVVQVASAVFDSMVTEACEAAGYPAHRPVEATEIVVTLRFHPSTTPDPAPFVQLCKQLTTHVATPPYDNTESNS